VGATNYDKALRFSGRCTVDGQQLFVTADFTYTSQPLHQANGASATALAAQLGVPVITALPTSGATAAVFTAYIDTWERLVTAAEDPTLVLPGLGVESCARTKREAVIRTRPGSTVPATTDPDFLAGHSYLALATINRPATQAPVNAGDATDVRPKRLTVADLQKRVTFIEQVALAPSFAAQGSQISPKQVGPTTNVTLNGHNFDKNPTVLFDSTPAPIPTGVLPTSTAIIVPAPVMAAGLHKITVTTVGGTVVSDDSITIILPPAPVFAAPGSQFAPASAALGKPVVLSGNNFNGGGLKVLVGGVDATASASGVTTTTITINVPASTPLGTQHISVSTFGGTATSVDLLTVTAT
jgi:hypothetical protein